MSSIDKEINDLLTTKSDLEKKLNKITQTLRIKIYEKSKSIGGRKN